MKRIILLGCTVLFASATATAFASDSLAMRESDRVTMYQRAHQPAQSVQAMVFDQALKPFYHGVASGDPLHDRVVLWTRVTPEVDGVVGVQWRIATDTALANIVGSGTVTTDASKDYTVKVDANGLQPNTVYYYGFSAMGHNSLTGRTRTAPVGSIDRLRFAVASCANYQQGYFNAYATMAKRNDLDAVLFLGDYIYEYPEGGYGYSEEVGRGHEPKNESITLDDYRVRYSFYRLDPDLRRVHQQFPFIAVWDDHETANDSYKDGAENHQASEGDWNTRKNEARQAYLEWLPVRIADTEHPQRIYRSFSYGELANITMIDTRLEGRVQQVADINGPEAQDTNRTIMGKEQLQWLIGQLEHSEAKWKIVGNQVVLAQIVGFANADAWDGYPVERDRLLQAVQEKNLPNIVFVTGDIHSSSAADISRNPFDTAMYTPTTGKGSLAAEFVTPSITSANYNEIINKPPRSAESLGAESLLQTFNKHLKYTELDSHGYLILDVDQERVQSDWFYADTILIAQQSEHHAVSFKVENATNHVAPASAPAPAKANMLPAPLFPPAVSTSVQEPTNSDVLLVGAYPNPASAYSIVHYALNAAGHVRVEVFSTDGQFVALLVDTVQQPGIYGVRFDVSSLAAGSYLCRIEHGGATATRTIVKQ